MFLGNATPTTFNIYCTISLLISLAHDLFYFALDFILSCHVLLLALFPLIIYIVTGSVGAQNLCFIWVYMTYSYGVE
jgi:hypothetical protein